MVTTLLSHGDLPLWKYLPTWHAMQDLVRMPRWPATSLANYVTPFMH